MPWLKICVCTGLNNSMECIRLTIKKKMFLDTAEGTAVVNIDVTNALSVILFFDIAAVISSFIIIGIRVSLIILVCLHFIDTTHILVRFLDGVPLESYANFCFYIIIHNFI